MMNISYWLIWGFAALVGLVVVYFFIIGLLDQSISSFNIGLWLVILFVVGGVLLGSLWLKSADHLFAAKAVCWILAAPGLIYLLFMLFVLIGNPRWN